jgi:hypothetical protein
MSQPTVGIAECHHALLCNSQKTECFERLTVASLAESPKMPCRQKRSPPLAVTAGEKHNLDNMPLAQVLLYSSARC